MTTIDAEMKAFLESEVDTFIATRDASLRPHVGRAWGTRVATSGEGFELLVDRSHSLDVLADLRENGVIATGWSHPFTHKTIQLKGRCVEIADPSAADFALLESHIKDFVQVIRGFGNSEEFCRQLWSHSIVRIRCLVEQAFDQTPGPGAGKPL
jgi:hypothetical protein